MCVLGCHLCYPPLVGLVKLHMVRTHTPLSAIPECPTSWEFKCPQVTLNFWVTPEGPQNTLNFWVTPKLPLSYPPKKGIIHKTSIFTMFCKAPPKKWVPKWAPMWAPTGCQVGDPVSKRFSDEPLGTLISWTTFRFQTIIDIPRYREFKCLPNISGLPLTTPVISEM